MFSCTLVNAWSIRVLVEFVTRVGVCTSCFRFRLLVVSNHCLVTFVTLNKLKLKSPSRIISFCSVFAFSMALSNSVFQSIYAADGGL